MHVTKPPKSNPHSDMDGVHEDERPNIETANDVGQDNEDVELAAEETVGRPPYTPDQEGSDDRAA